MSTTHDQAAADAALAAKQKRLADDEETAAKDADAIVAANAAAVAAEAAVVADRAALVVTPPSSSRPLYQHALKPFAATSIWNTPVAANGVFQPETSPATASMLGGDATTWLNQGTYSHPITQAYATDPVAVVTDTGDASRGGTYHVPADAPIAAGSDAHMHIVSPDGLTLDEAWYTSRVSSTAYNVGRHARVDLLGSGVGPQRGVRAYGGSAIGGLIRSWEIDPTHSDYTGRIDHPIAMALRGDQMLCTGGTYGYDANGYGRSLGYIPPATEQDYNSLTAYSGKCPMGAHFAIPPTVDLTTLGLSSAGLMLATAYQKFGGYVVDTSGTTILAYVEPGAVSDFVSLVLAPSWGAKDLRTIRRQLRQVIKPAA